MAPAEQEIPVEIIAEPPPAKEPDPAPPKSEQQAQQKTLDEKEAHDAPRAPNDEKVQREARDEASHSPKAKPESDSAPTKPANDPAPSSEKTVASKTAEASAPKLKDDRADGEPVNTAELQRPETPEQTKAEAAAPKPEKQPTAAQNPMAAFAAMPDYSFAAASKNSPVAGGKADSTYLSIVYGLVSSHLHLPNAPDGRAHTGEIAFDVDFAGSLIRVRVIKASGLPELDAAALAAIRAAAPFPLPPTGTGLSLRLHYTGS